MPQIGFLLPDGTEARFEECVAGSANPGVPAPLVRALITGIVDNPHKGDMISVTSLLGCLRAIFLERTREYFAAPIQNWFPHRGTVMHKAMEAEVEGWERETAYSRDFGGVMVAGRIDAYDSRNRVLYDWKTTSASRLEWLRVYGPPREHILQLNAYRLLLEASDRPVDEMKLVYLEMNRLAITGLVEPWAGGVVGLPSVPRIPDEELETLFAANARTLRDAFQHGTMPPIASAETRKWKCHRFCPVKNYCAEIGDNPALAAPVWSNIPAWASLPASTPSSLPVADKIAIPPPPPFYLESSKEGVS